MTARDDYPRLAGCVPGTTLTNEIARALDEIDRLRSDTSNAETKPGD